jgi:hypothetical protein
LSTDHKARVALGGNTTITVDELFLIVEMAHFQSGDKLRKKIYRNTFKILEKNSAESTLTKTVLNEIRKETITLFNEDKAPTLKVLKMDLSKVKGTKCADCYGCQLHCVDYRTNTWCGPRFHKDAKTAGKSDVRALLTNVEEDLYMDHEGNLVTVDDDFSQAEMMCGLAQQANARMRKVIESIFVVNSLYCFTTVHEWGSVEMYTCSNTGLGRKRKNRWFCFFYILTPPLFFYYNFSFKHVCLTIHIDRCSPVR